MTPRLRKVLLAAVAALALFAAAFPALELAIEPKSLAPIGGGLAVLGALLAVYRRLDRAPRIQDTLEGALWGIALSNLFYVPMYALVRLPRPLADDALARADRALGVDVASLVAFGLRHPGLARLLAGIYDSMTLVCVLALVVPPLLGRAAWTAELLLALVLAIAQSLVLLALVQGVGPWVHGGFSPSSVQVSCEDAMKAMKTGGVYRIDLGAPDPLVVFPSWHVILALLAGFALARHRRVRPFAIAWSIGTVLSTLTTGWHYLVDVLGGIAVAVVSIYAAHRLGKTAWIGIAAKSEGA